MLKIFYPKGIKVLSFFSGIDDLEITIYKLGIKLKVVVNVGINEGTHHCIVV
jgi:hypothetical protein